MSNSVKQSSTLINGGKLIVIFIIFRLSTACTSSFATSQASTVQAVTPTLVKATPSNPPKSTLSPSITSPIPTLTFKEAQQEIEGLIENNNGCQLPCILGFYPGISTKDDIDTFLSKFSEEYHSEEVQIEFPQFDEMGGLIWIEKKDGFRLYSSMAYYLQGQDAINLVELKATTYLDAEPESNLTISDIFGYKRLLILYDDYLLPNVLALYGSPKSILIAPYFDERPGFTGPSWIWFSVVLDFEDEGFLVEYIMPRRTIGSDYAACPTQVVELTVIGWDPSQSLELSEILSVKSGLGIGRSLLDYFMPLEQATTLSITEFSEIFSPPNTDVCIFTPQNMWPQP